MRRLSPFDPDQAAARERSHERIRLAEISWLKPSRNARTSPVRGQEVPLLFAEPSFHAVGALSPECGALSPASP